MKIFPCLTLVTLAFACVAAAQTPGATVTITEGSTTTHRGNVDGDTGEIYIYIGGSFPAGTAPTTFTFLWDFVGRGGNSTGCITPLLLERVAGAFYTTYVVRGIGEGFAVNINSSPQTIPFNILQGVKVTRDSNFTFGYVNALVDTTGQEISTSAGTVDMDYPADSGAGVGAKSLNLWAATGDTTVSVALGTTIGGQGTDLAWVNYVPVRTYSGTSAGFRGAVKDGRLSGERLSLGRVRFRIIKWAPRGL